MRKSQELDLRLALMKDFRALFTEKFCTDWQAKRLIMDTYIETMRLDNVAKLFAQAGKREG